MPVTIHELSSTVNVVDTNLPWSPQDVERLVQLVIQRLRDMERWETLTQQERALPSRMTAED